MAHGKVLGKRGGFGGLRFDRHRLQETLFGFQGYVFPAFRQYWPGSDPQHCTPLFFLLSYPPAGWGRGDSKGGLNAEPDPAGDLLIQTLFWAPGGCPHLLQPRAGKPKLLPLENRRMRKSPCTIQSQQTPGG